MPTDHYDRCARDDVTKEGRSPFEHLVFRTEQPKRKFNAADLKRRVANFFKAQLDFASSRKHALSRVDARIVLRNARRLSANSFSLPAAVSG